MVKRKLIKLRRSMVGKILMFYRYHKFLLELHMCFLKNRKRKGNKILMFYRYHKFLLELHMCFLKNRKREGNKILMFYRYHKFLLELPCVFLKTRRWWVCLYKMFMTSRSIIFQFPTNNRNLLSKFYHRSLFQLVWNKQKRLKYLTVSSSNYCPLYYDRYESYLDYVCFI
jgi:hypothetical protein